MRLIEIKIGTYFEERQNELQVLAGTPRNARTFNEEVDGKNYRDALRIPCEKLHFKAHVLSKQKSNLEARLVDLRCRYERFQPADVRNQPTLVGHFDGHLHGLVRFQKLSSVGPFGVPIQVVALGLAAHPSQHQYGMAIRIQRQHCFHYFSKDSLQGSTEIFVPMRCWRSWLSLKLTK